MDAERVTLVYEEARESLVRRLAKWSGDREVAEDAVQEAFARLLDRETTELPTRAEAWLARVASNIVISDARRRERANRYARRLPADEATARSAEASCLARDDSRRVRRALQRLPDRHRDVLVLSASGYRAGEIARIQGRSGGAARVHLMRARRALRLAFDGAAE